MAVVVMRDGTEYVLPEPRGSRLRRELPETKKKFLDLYGDQTAVVATSAIANVVSDEQFEQAWNKKQGNLKCAQGHWRPKHESFCAACQTENKKLSFVHDAPKMEKPSTTKDQWMELIRRNVKTLRETGKYGKLTKLSEL